MNTLEQNYFNYTKSKLVRIALEEGLAKHCNMNYNKVGIEKLDKKVPQPLGSNNSIASIYKTVFS